MVINARKWSRQLGEITRYVKLKAKPRNMFSGARDPLCRWWDTTALSNFAPQLLPSGGAPPLGQYYILRCLHDSTDMLHLQSSYTPNISKQKSRNDSSIRTGTGRARKNWVGICFLGLLELKVGNCTTFRASQLNSYGYTATVASLNYQRIMEVSFCPLGIA